MKKQSHVLFVLLVAMLAPTSQTLVAMKRKRSDDDQGEDDRRKIRRIEQPQVEQPQNEVNSLMEKLLLNCITANIDDPILVMHIYIKNFKKIIAFVKKAVDDKNPKTQTQAIDILQKKILKDALGLRQKIEINGVSTQLLLRKRIVGACEKNCNSLVTQQAIKNLIKKHLPRPQFSKKRQSHHSPTEQANERQQAPVPVTPIQPAPGAQPTIRHPFGHTGFPWGLQGPGTFPFPAHLINRQPEQRILPQAPPQEQIPLPIPQKTFFQVTIHPYGTITINQILKPIPVRQPSKVMPIKKGKKGKKTLPDLSYDSLQNVLLYMSQNGTSLTDALTNLARTCRSLKTTISHMAQHTHPIKTFLQYAKTNQILLKETVHIYLKLTEAVDKLKRDNTIPVSLEFEANDLRVDTLLPVYQILLMQQYEQNQQSEQLIYFAKKIKIIETMIRKTIKFQVDQEESTLFWHRNMRSHNLHSFTTRSLPVAPIVFKTYDLAEKYNNIEAIHFLIELVTHIKSLLLNQPDYYRYNQMEEEIDNHHICILQRACKSGNKTIAKLIVKTLGTRNFLFICAETNLIEITKTFGHTDLTDYFLKEINSYEAEWKSKLDKTPRNRDIKSEYRDVACSLIVIAASMGDLDRIKTLFKNFPARTAHTNDVTLAIKRALEGNHRKVAQYILKKIGGTKLNTSPYANRPVVLEDIFRVCAQKGFVKTIKRLLKSDTKRNKIKNSLKRHAKELLIIAGKHGNFKFVRYLIEQVNVDYEANDCNTADKIRNQVPSLPKSIAAKKFIDRLSHMPSPLEVAYLYALEEGAKAIDPVKRNKYKEIIQLLAQKSKKLLRILTFVHEIPRKPKKRKRIIRRQRDENQ